MIYVDDVGIPADVLNTETGGTVHGPWYHLISDQIDQTELHKFAYRLGLRRSYFQPGKELARPDEHDPGKDHYDVTEGKRQQAIKMGAKSITGEELGAVMQRKRAVHRFGFLDIAVVAVQLADQDGTFALSCRDGKWTVAIEWGHENPDSPMCAAAAYGLGDTAQEAVAGAMADAGWL